MLPKRVDENEVADFSVFAAHLETPLEPEFQPDGAAVRKLARFSGQGGGVSVAFDRKLLGDKVKLPNHLIYYQDGTYPITMKKESGLKSILRLFLKH